MANEIEKLVSKIAPMFVELNAQLHERQLKWALGRAAAIREFKSNPENKKTDTWSYYTKLFALAGGKTWYTAFNGRGDAFITEFITKNVEATIEKRNYLIAKKLVAKGISEITGTHVINSNGFEGTYVATNSEGKKAAITINVIMAGGYNIQCLHCRTLVKVR